LIVAGASAIGAAIEVFARRGELSWDEQVLVVAEAPLDRQLAGMASAILSAGGPTQMVGADGARAATVRARGVGDLEGCGRRGAGRGREDPRGGVMAAKSDRFLVVGSSPHPWEREAIDFAFTALEGRGDPFQGRGLVELLDPSGSLYEIDLLVIGYSAIYVVEIKSHPGTIEGDHVEWLWTTPEGRRIHVGSPLGLTNHKCKVLRSALERTMRGRAPWVQPLIFLSDPDVQIRLTGASRTAVVGRAGLQRALVHGDFPGNEQVKGRERIPTPVMREVIQALSKLGIRARRAKLQVGEYELGAHLGDGRTYQDYEATHVALKDMRRRARIYRVPEHTSSERQAACRRQAEREVRLLQEVGQHPNILSVHAYHVTGEQGPTILFEEFAGGVTLDRFVRRDLELSLDDRIELLQQVSRAVAHCHRKSMMHGGLEPESVLVRRGEGGKVEVRLLNFQLGASELVSPTVHRTELLSARASVYQAPELAADASARGPHSDVFGLGALAFFLFTGEAPAASLEARDAVLGAVGGAGPLDDPRGRARGGARRDLRGDEADPPRSDR
jgi:tRNA A-37 threonylcarbamoyl transferase component Bud32